jgi:amidase
VRDSAALLDVTAGSEEGALYHAPPVARPFLQEVGADPGVLRIAFTTKPFLGVEVHPDCVRGVEETAVLCQNLGHEVVEDAPPFDRDSFFRAFLTMIYGQVRADIALGERFLGHKARFADYEPATWTLGLLGSQFTAADFSEALGVLQSNARQMAPFFAKYDVLLTPTLAQPPVKTGSLRTGGFNAWAMRFFGRLNAGWIIKASGRATAVASEIFKFMPYTTVFNATGQPAISLPLHWNEAGLPIGMQFVGRLGDEATLFRLAAQLEQAKPWFHRRPAILNELPRS